MLRITLHCILPLLLAAPTLAEDWPCWRGPTRQGVSAEKGLPIHWTATENVAWKTAIPGKGWSSPIIFDDRVFVTTATDGGVSCRVICLDRRTGKALWNKEALRQDPGHKNRKNSYASPTPATDGRRVYAVFGDGSLVALDYHGSVKWINRDFPYYSEHGLGGSPVLCGNLLIMAFDGSGADQEKALGWKKPWDRAVLLALDGQTGEVRWKGRRGLSRIAHVTPNVLRLDDRVQIISAAGDVVQGFDAATGKRIWTVSSKGEGVVPSIVLGGELIFTASGFEDPTIRAIRTGGRGDVTATHIAWEIEKAVPMIPSFVYVRGLLFTINESGVAMCIEGKTGTILWQQRIGGRHSASPIYGDGRIYYLSEDGESTIVDADRRFRVVARNQIDETCQASCAVSRGQLFIRSEKHLYCIGTTKQRD